MSQPNHLFIGLGGQGARSLAALRKVRRQRAADTKQLEEELGQRWGFLSIDSSNSVWSDRAEWTYFGEDLRLNQDSLHHLNPADLSAFLNSATSRADVAPWCQDFTPIENLISGGNLGDGEGANQKRRMGRLLLHQNRGGLMRAIQGKVANLQQGSEASCWFHVFASVAGGTGSGCLVDLVAWIRDAYPKDHYKIHLYLYTTDNNDNVTRNKVTDKILQSDCRSPVNPSQ